MRCGKVRRNLMAYHDGELGMAAGKKVTKHLETCVECSSLLAALEKADHATGSATGPGPDSSYWDTFTDRVMKKIKDEALVQRHEPERRPIRPRFSPVRFAPALSVALVVVVAAGVFMKIRQPTVPERAVYHREAVVGEEVSTAPKERPMADLENKGVTNLSEKEQITAEPEPAKQVEKPAVRKEASASVKKEAAADEMEQLAPAEEEAEIRFAEKDDNLTGAEPPPIDQDSTRSFLAVRPQELGTGVEGFVEMEEPPIAAEAIDDGSWGQLAFARRLEEEGNHVESEKVLEDLLARNPSQSVQEQVSLLMVSVLTNQNRLPEARQVLEDAQRQYPANMMIQNLKIRNGEEGIGNKE